jgi:hypothetical protein
MIVAVGKTASLSSIKTVAEFNTICQPKSLGMTADI